MPLSIQCAPLTFMLIVEEWVEWFALAVWLLAATPAVEQRQSDRAAARWTAVARARCFHRSFISALLYVLSMSFFFVVFVAWLRVEWSRGTDEWASEPH